MNVLGFINFSILGRLLWKSADHFLPMQTFYLGYMKEIWLSVHSPGIISGCVVSVNAALTLDITSGLILFSNGELVTVDAQQVTLAAADPSDPRLDRLEYIHSIENNIAVIDIDAVSKQFDKIQTGTAGASTGTPAGSPVVNVKTAGAISISIISLAATQTLLTSGDIDVRETARDLARKVENTEVEEDINNNASGDFLPLLIADKARYRQVWVHYNIQRKTDTGSSGVTQSGVLSLRLNSETGEWSRTDTQEGSAGVDFEVEAATGRISYDSSNIAGATYIGKVKYTTRTISV